MTELERKALLGDKDAQSECTKKGIVLPCPCCGGTADTWIDSAKAVVCCQVCGEYISVANYDDYKSMKCVIAFWNTRPAPPIGRCMGCKNWDGIRCSNVNFLSGPFDYCSYFEPKENEEK